MGNSELFICLTQAYQDKGELKNRLIWSRNARDAQPILKLKKEGWAVLTKSSELRYAQFQSKSTLLSLLSINRELINSIDLTRTGVLGISGPHLLDVAHEYSKRLINRGDRYVNPIQFPNTLQSSVPCEIAAHFGISGCALAFGHDSNAILDCLKTSYSLISNQVLDNILISASGCLEPYFADESTENCDEAISFSMLITKRPVSDNHQNWRLKDILSFAEQIRVGGIKERYYDTSLIGGLKLLELILDFPPE